jgi:predicted DNA-binding protein (UPF0251 family)
MPLRIDPDELERFMDAENIGSRFELAKRMGVSSSTVYRTVDGSIAPGTKTIAGLRRAFPGRDTGRLITEK